MQIAEMKYLARKDMPEGKRFTKRFEMMILIALFTRKQGLPKVDPKKLRRVLLVRYDRLGDMVITTPVIETLHRLAPQARIDVLASPANRAIVESDPRVTQVFVWGRTALQRIRVMMKLRAQKYDLVLQLILGRASLPSTIVSFIAGRNGVTAGKELEDYRKELLNYHVKVDQTQHFREQTYSVFASALELKGDDALPPQYSITISPEDHEIAELSLKELHIEHKEFIVVNISAGKPERELYDDANVELLKRLGEIGRPLVVMSLPHVNSKAQSLASKAGGAVQTVSFGSVMAAAAFVSHARLLITPDTGLAHIACAVGTPVVDIFAGHGDIIGWGPRNVPNRVVKSSGSYGMKDISVDDVTNAARELLEGDT